MSTAIRAAAALVVVALCQGLLSASDRVAVYGRIERVVLLPNAEAPEAAQVFGVFSVAIRTDPNDYKPAEHGYLFYKLPTDRRTALREWNDLREVAGTGQIVAFGIRWEGVPTLRAASTPPASPDLYTLNAGVVKINNRTDYAPIRAILTFKP